MTIQQKTLEIALTQLGVHEAAGNKNTGKEVEKYLASVNLGPEFTATYSIKIRRIAFCGLLRS